MHRQNCAILSFPKNRFIWIQQSEKDSCTHFLNFEVGKLIFGIWKILLDIRGWKCKIFGILEAFKPWTCLNFLIGFFKLKSWSFPQFSMTTNFYASNPKNFHKQQPLTKDFRFSKSNVQVTVLSGKTCKYKNSELAASFRVCLIVFLPFRRGKHQQFAKSLSFKATKKFSKLRRNKQKKMFVVFGWFFKIGLLFGKL